jgi:acyl-CoA reductase-like NAD-dependent aldehyde dehydrogenase
MTGHGEKQSAQTWKERARCLAVDARHFIDGGPAGGTGLTWPKLNPATGEKIADVPRGNARDVDAAVAVARRTFRSGVWSRMPPRSRIGVMAKFANLVEENAKEFALLDTLDTGKPIFETTTIDLPITVRCLRFFAEAIDKVDGRVTNTVSHVLHYVRHQPLGVVGCIVPWNYPVMMAAWKVGPALAVGNSVVLKPAEQSPLSALLLARLFVEAGGPPGVFNVVNGFGPEAGRALATHMDVDKIAFTGSAEVGKLMMVYAGQSNMKRVSTECGGKSPQIIMDDADVETAAKFAVDGIYQNQGQICSAGSRLLVHERVYDAFLEEFTRITRDDYRIGDPLDPATTMGSLVSRDQQKRVLDYIETGIGEGARLEFGGSVPDGFAKGCYVEPTLFLDVRNSMKIAREEIFGPVAGMMRFSDPGEALAIANDSIYGLAASIWTRNLDRALKFARDVESGIVWVNTYETGDPTSPWGGFKQSGFGRDKSLEAMTQYTQSKSVWINLSQEP